MPWSRTPKPIDRSLQIYAAGLLIVETMIAVRIFRLPAVGWQEKLIVGLAMLSAVLLICKIPLGRTLFLTAGLVNAIGALLSLYISILALLLLLMGGPPDTIRAIFISVCELLCVNAYLWLGVGLCLRR
jgi:hypothetical protein